VALQEPVSASFDDVGWFEQHATQPSALTIPAPRRRAVTSPPRPTGLDAPIGTRAGRRSLSLLLRTVDLAAVTAGVALAHGAMVLRGSVDGASLVPLLLEMTIVALWLGFLHLGNTYEYRFLGSGVYEFRRVITATVQFFALLLATFYLLGFNGSRLYFAVALPAGLALLLIGRRLVRHAVRRRRQQGQLRSRVLVVGDPGPARSLTHHLAQDPAVGYDVVGLALPDGPDALLASVLGDDIDEDDLPDVLGSIDDVTTLVDEYSIDVVAIAAGEHLHHEDLNQVAWSLEGKDVDLVVSPALLNVAGPRITVRPVGGAPLLYIDEPRLSGPARLAKATVDRAGAFIGLLFALVPLLAVSLAIKLDSRGPVFFRQWRVGKDGRLFRVFKFRTMVPDAEERRADIDGLSHANGLLWKAEDDPRITPVGRFLRRTSLDEVPQLLNVLLGDMSLVGPRPLAVDPAQFRWHEQRRHKVKPGITGLWQVEARQEQDWENAVRLDLQYVDNWSMALDFAILARTAGAVLRGT